MAIIAITGSIGAGKSTALNCFAELGAPTAEADKLAHQAYQPGSPVHSLIQQRWGEKILTVNGEIDRSALAKIVFQRPEELHWLNQIVHPFVKKNIISLEKTLSGNLWCAVPLLFETGWQEDMYKSICVWCSPKIQKNRLLARGWTEAEISQRLKHHWSTAAKAASSDYVIINQGSRDNLLKQCQILYNEIEYKIRRNITR